MKTLNTIEKIFGTVYILFSLVLVPLAGNTLLWMLPNFGVVYVGQYYFFFLPISIFFFVVSLILTRKVDMGQLESNRRLRRLFYIILIAMPVAILIIKSNYR